ncbi:hypothetical protein SORBI_3003G270650 [Sorghum bicolor]|uniref:Uncharacterized protein n=1 Tax=Sorghum bicolor TaxID=4558 RepID=A0A1W0VZ62_SORBI|nr:hypothetical protein SORBI_3003G270650 [Sorghum bicolor]
MRSHCNAFMFLQSRQPESPSPRALALHETGYRPAGNDS